MTDSLTISQIRFLDVAFAEVVSDLAIPDCDNEFVSTAVRAMLNLKEAGRSNMIRGLVNCVGLEGSAGQRTRLPLDRMPTGYIEYQIQFFNASHSSTVCAIKPVQNK